MDCYTQTFPIARKVHECELCGKQIEKGERYSHQKWKDGGEFYDSKLCLVCESICTKYAKEEHHEETDYDIVLEWVYSEYCYYCENCKNCQYSYSDIPNCPRIRKHFESLGSD